MAVRFERSTKIAAPIESAFALALDVDFHKESFAKTGEEIVDGIDSGGMVLGDTVTWRAKHFGVWWKMTSVIDAYDPPRFFVDRQLKGPFKSFRHEHHFAPTSDGGTSMTDIVEFTAPLGPLGSIAESLALRKHMTALIDLRNDDLKKALEQTSPQR